MGNFLIGQKPYVGQDILVAQKLLIRKCSLLARIPWLDLFLGWAAALCWTKPVFEQIPWLVQIPKLGTST